MHAATDILETDVVTGERTRFGVVARKALIAMGSSGVPFAVIGATALAVRGLPRMTRDLDLVVLIEDAFAALDALAAAGFHSITPIARDAEPEPMYALRDGTGAEVDLLVAASEPETTVIAEAEPADVFGARSPVASLEHLVLMYLYSNQPRHLGDLARIVTDTGVDLGRVESYLREVHPEMLPTLAARVEYARHPPPAPMRPKRR